MPYKDREAKKAQARRYYRTHKRQFKKWHGDYYRTHRADWHRRGKDYNKKRYWAMKTRVFELIAGTTTPRCVVCGCNNPLFLEINHKNGGGRKEMQSGSHLKFLKDIQMGLRSTTDLEIRCRVCNALDFLARKDPEGVKRYSITYGDKY